MVYVLVLDDKEYDMDFLHIISWTPVALMLFVGLMSSWKDAEWRDKKRNGELD